MNHYIYIYIRVPARNIWIRSAAPPPGLFALCIYTAANHDPINYKRDFRCAAEEDMRAVDANRSAGSFLFSDSRAIVCV